MRFAGFRPEDFLYFLDSDTDALVAYMRDELHPRLRDLGQELAGELSRSVGADLRAQLRSGRWFRNPWATWTAIISTEESVRSDNARPRLCVFVDQHEALVGFMHCVWRPRWQGLVEEGPSLAKAIDRAAKGPPKLQCALAHWTEGERRTSTFGTARELLAAAAKWGQDFVLVGRAYPFPPEADLLTSPAFAEEALQVLKGAWPVYRWAFGHAGAR